MATAKTTRKALTQQAIKTACGAMTILCTQLANADLVPFGQSYTNSDYKTVCDSLIAHRITSKWHIPNKRVQNQLKAECIANWNDHEEQISSFTFDDSQTMIWDTDRDGWVKSQNDITPNHYKAIKLMRDWLRPVTHMLKEWDAYVNPDPKYMDLDFTPGESFVSSGGFTSVRQKLMTSTWTVTPDLMDWALDAIWSHKTLNESAMSRLWPLATDYAWNNRILSWFQGGRISMRSMFQLYVRKYLLVIVDGARASSVEKNIKTRRFINIEPLFNMLYQRGVGLIIRHALSFSANNDLLEGQHAHNLAIRTMFYSTIDLRNASDSNIYIAARALLSRASPELWKCIDRSRSQTTTFFNYPVKGEDMVVTNCKLSSMGNGYTFEVMTLLLLAQARVFDVHARVYGDDIIIRNDGPHGLNAAVMFIDLISTTGWQINVNKTFHDSRFYESCGGFVHDGTPLVSYDFGPILTVIDLITTVNKLSKVLEFTNSYNSKITGFLSVARETILSSCPHVIRGPVRELGVSPLNKVSDYHKSLTEVNCDYIESSSYLKFSRSSPDVSKAFRDHGWLALRLKQLGYMTGLPVVTGKVYRPKVKEERLPRDSVQCVFTKNFYLYANRVQNDVQRDEVHWSTVTCFISRNGYVLPVAHAREILRRHIRANQVGPRPLCCYPSLIQSLCENTRGPNRLIGLSENWMYYL